MVVPDGTYTVWFELTDADRAGANSSATFEKGPAPVSVSPPDMKPYTGLKITYTP